MLVGHSLQPAEKVLRRKQVRLDPGPLGYRRHGGVHRKAGAAEELVPGSRSPVVHRFHGPRRRPAGQWAAVLTFPTGCLVSLGGLTAQGREQADLRGDAELSVDRREVVAHRAWREGELACDVGAALALTERADDLHLACGQPLHRGQFLAVGRSAASGRSRLA